MMNRKVKITHNKFLGNIYKMLVAYLKFSVKGAKELCLPCIGRERNRPSKYRVNIQIS